MAPIPQSVVLEKPTRGTYILLGIYGAIFSLLIAIAIFNFTWMMWAGKLEDAGKSVTSLVVVVIGMGIGGNRLWKSILKREPEAVSAFRQKQKKFTHVATMCVGALIVISLGAGIKVGMIHADADARRKRLGLLLDEMKTAGPKNMAFRKNLAAIRVVQPTSFAEYYQQCLKLEALLNDYEPQLNKNLAFQKSYSDFIASDPRLRTNLKLNATAEFLRRTGEMDIQAMVEWRGEIAKTKELMSLPRSDRSVFYKREIEPILVKEDEIGKAERGLMLDAQQKGIQLPSDMSESLRNK